MDLNADLNLGNESIVRTEGGNEFQASIARRVHKRPTNGS